MWIADGWKEYELIEPSPKTSYRREITWSVFNEKVRVFIIDIIYLCC